MRRAKFHIVTNLLAFAAIAALGTAPARAGTIYSNNFEGVVGLEWSSSTTDTTPVGARRFLGQFGNDTVSLTLTGLAPHAGLTVAFDLFVIRSLDGNHQDEAWDLSVTGGPTLLRTTFSNNDGSLQSYPAARHFANNPAETGAAEVDTLGYTFIYPGNNPRPADSVYNLSFDFSHTANSVTFNFSASGMEGLLNESWGIDNVVVSDNNVSAVPEPSALTLAALGTVGVLASGWRRRRRQLVRDSYMALKG